MSDDPGPRVGSALAAVGVARVVAVGVGAIVTCTDAIAGAWMGSGEARSPAAPDTSAVAPRTVAPMTDPHLWRQVIDANLTSAFLLTREVLDVLRRQGLGGSVVYVASKNAVGPGVGFGADSVSKAGMVQLMRVGALEGGERGIRANAVNPDAVFETALWSDEIRAERAAAHGVPVDRLETFYAERNVLHRRVTAADVAEAVVFLLSDRSSRTTGGVLAVDGGVPGAFVR